MRLELQIVELDLTVNRYCVVSMFSSISFVLALVSATANSFLDETRHRIGDLIITPVAVSAIFPSKVELSDEDVIFDEGGI